MRKQIYASPAATTRCVELEDWIATTPEVSAAIGSNSVSWGTETRLGDTPATEGGDVYFAF
jgi:hypothetical protein